MNCWVECPACGEYRVSNLFLSTRPETYIKPADMVRLRGVVREAADADQDGRFREVISTDNYEQIIARHNEPRSPLEQMERLIVWVANTSAFFGAPANLGRQDALARRLYLPDEFVREFLHKVTAAGYMRNLRLPNDLGEGFCELLEGGWRLAERLHVDERRGDQAFVAMWFHPDMRPAYDDGIHPALRLCGHTPYIVNRAPSDKKIDDDIIANIRNSRLVVADLTGLRASVFYEAGFAHGLGIPLVLTCQKSAEVPFVQAAPNGSVSKEPEKRTWADHVERHAFDIRNYVILRWSTPAELATVLEANIRARALELPARPAR